MLHNFEHEFDQIAHEAWQERKTPLEQMYDSWMGERRWEPVPPSVTYRIHDQVTEKPISCHICDSTDKWVIEGDEVQQIARVFICEHEPVWVGRGMIRQISSVPVHKVGRFEETSRPLE